MKIKPRTFKTALADIKIEVYKSGFVEITHLETPKYLDNPISISLGAYPNARWELIEECLRYIKKNMEKK